MNSLNTHNTYKIYNTNKPYNTNNTNNTNNINNLNSKNYPYPDEIFDLSDLIDINEPNQPNQPNQPNDPTGLSDTKNNLKINQDKIFSTLIPKTKRLKVYDYGFLTYLKQEGIELIIEDGSVYVLMSSENFSLMVNNYENSVFKLFDLTGRELKALIKESKNKKLNLDITN